MESGAPADLVALVEEFHRKLRYPVEHEPGPASAGADHYCTLLREEAAEYCQAADRRDLVQMADALADIVYTALGASISHGIPFYEIFSAVHRSNMTKEATADPAAPPGKAEKGPAYRPPSIEPILRRHGWRDG